MNINFIKFAYEAFILSFFLCLVSIFCIFYKGINFGLEFTGGIEIELESKSNFDSISYINDKLKNVKNYKVRYYGSKKNLQIRISNTSKSIYNILEQIKVDLSDKFKILEINIVGADISFDLIKKTFTAIFIAFFAMFFYLSTRFEFKFAASAVITLLHDILILLGFISFFKIDLDLIVLSSIFAVFGYSVNDTVVIFDRVRENMKIYRKDDIKNLINFSVNSTFSRTLITSFTTLGVTFVLLFFSTSSLFYFSLVLSFGIIMGTYSSIYISTFFLYFLNSKISFLGKSELL